VAGSVGIKIEDDETRSAAMNDLRDFIVGARGGIAENTFRLLASDGLRNVLVAPRRPQKIH
jgi:NADP-dependent 3-hydroxy acid dehydrogenase YdfG